MCTVRTSLWHRFVVGVVGVTTHKTPKINIEAASLRGFINWNLLVHTQSCERAVHEVAMSTEAGYGQEQMDGLVRALYLDPRKISSDP